MADKNMSTGWTTIQMVGLLVLALGAAFSAYSAYNMFSTPSSTGAFRQAFNGTGGFSGGRNFSRGNFTGRFNGTIPSGLTASAFGGESLISRIGDLLSGILMILLGVVTYMYGGLKKLVDNRHQDHHK